MRPPEKTGYPRRNGEGGGTGLARALSKLGLCSRSQGRDYILAGRVELNGKVCRDPERRVHLHRDQIKLDARRVQAAPRVYLMLNKPRGLVTTASDEQGRPTVFSCLQGQGFPPLGAVGRLDKASEGLLLLTNDTSWAARITAPESGLKKIYHVQVSCIPTQAVLEQLRDGVQLEGELLAAAGVTLLRQGEKNSWLEIVLTEGKNRHIRRLLEAFGIEVLRLMRVGIGPLQLGQLPKAGFRHLSSSEIAALAGINRP